MTLRKQSEQREAMSEAPIQVDAGSESQPVMPVRCLNNYVFCPRLVRLSELGHRQTTSVNDALERTDGDGRSSRREEAHFEIGTECWQVRASQSLVTSAATNREGDGSNQSSSASFAFRTASSSESPAEAQPGNFGKNAAYRFVSGSCSTTSRNFMWESIILRTPLRNGRMGFPQAFGRQTLNSQPATHR